METGTFWGRLIRIKLLQCGKELRMGAVGCQTDYKGPCGDKEIHMLFLNHSDAEKEEKLYSDYAENADFRYIDTASMYTPQQRRRQILNAFAPVLMFLIFMGVFIFSLLQCLFIKPYSFKIISSVQTSKQCTGLS